MTLKSINPSNDSLIKEYNELSEDCIHEKIAKAHSSFHQWKNTPWGTREELLRHCGKKLDERKEELGKLISIEMGKPIGESIAEIEKCVWLCEYYAEQGPGFLANNVIETDANESYISYEPLGVILAIMPWNFPFWQVFRFAVPSILAGNTGILKHASNVSGCALAIEEIFNKSGFPDGVFQSLLIGSDKVENVISNPFVKAVTLTGSEKAGSSVASLAGKNIKKTVLELGGSDPFIVLNDADFELAAKIAVKSRFINNGQSCIAAKRFIIENNAYEPFLEMVKKEFANFKVGDPLDENNNVGPLARKDLAEGVLKQIHASIDKGAALISGGNKLFDKGAFVEPTLLANVSKGMPVFDEEVFGPVMPLIKANDIEECIMLANDTQYGLGSSLWTRDIEKAKKLIPQINAGSVFVNGMVKSDPRLPFGGINMSGYGRELSEVGMKEFLNIKTVWLKH